MEHIHNEAGEPRGAAVSIGN